MDNSTRRGPRDAARLVSVRKIYGGTDADVVALAGVTADLEAAGRQTQRPAPWRAREVAGSGELRVRPDLDDASELLDAKPKAAYKPRLDELGAGLEEAERCHDPGRAAGAGAERDFLVGEQARAVGLGGRNRRASHAERARLNVARAIRAAMDGQSRPHQPAPVRHLSSAIRTSRYCSYTPDPPRSPGNCDLAGRLRRAGEQRCTPVERTRRSQRAIPDRQQAPGRAADGRSRQRVWRTNRRRGL